MNLICMSLIENWYCLKCEAVLSGDNLAEKVTEIVNGVKRTTTLFPSSAFPTREQREHAAERIRQEFYTPGGKWYCAESPTLIERFLEGIKNYLS